MADGFLHPETGEELVTTWRTGKPHISFSELSDWIDCPFRHKLIHIDKLGTFTPTPHIFFGTGVHASNEEFIRTRKMDKSLAHAVITKGWRDNEELFTKGPFPDWASGGFGVLDDWLRKADTVTDDVPTFLDKEFPGWECYAAEEMLYERIEGHPLHFKGYIDAVLAVPDKKGNPKYWIIDWKTCGWGWAKEKQQDFNVQLQLILYKNFWTQRHKIEPRDVRCGFALLKRDAKPGKSVGIVPISVGPVTSARGLKVIENHARAVSKGFFPKNRDSCRFCEFRDTQHCPSNL